MAKRVDYPKIFVIAHGKTEVIFVKTIKAQLRIPIEIISHNSGKNNIEITSINDYILKNRELKSEAAFTKKFALIKDKKSKKIENLYIFPIMDLEKGYDEELKIQYRKNILCNKLWMAQYLFSIYNDDCIETVFRKVGLPHAIDQRDKSNYSQYFLKLFSEGNPIEVIENIHYRLKQSPRTNMEVFLEKCLELQREMNQ